MYQWIRGCSESALQMVRNEDKEYTVGIAEMEASIRAAWKPVSRQCDAHPEPSTV